MRSCPQCKTAYPDDVAVCTRDGVDLDPAEEDVPPRIEPTASIAPPMSEDVFVSELSGAENSASESEGETRAGRPKASQSRGVKKKQGAAPAAGEGNKKPEDRVGETLGSYRLVEVIGRGGMGAVYRAEHVRLPGREVALKLLRADYAQRRESVGRFIREAQSVNRIRHRNIVDVSDIVELDDGSTFIIMELLSGDSLGKLMRKPGALTPARSLNLLLQICDGLLAAHEKGIVHRDLKPDNVFISVDAEGRDLVKLLDFGVAKLLSGDDSEVSVHTVAGSVIGTPAFMSPEQAGGMQVGPSSDIYSLGAIMYEIFAGTPPFKGKTFGEFVRKHLNDAPVPLRQTQGGAHTDPRIEAIALRCLEKNPKRRYPGARELRDALYEVYASLATDPRAPSHPAPPAASGPPGGDAPSPSGTQPAVSGPWAATLTPDPEPEQSSPMPALDGSALGQPPGHAQPTPPPATPEGTPPADSLSQSGAALPTPPPQTPPPHSEVAGYPAGAEPPAQPQPGAPLSAQQAAVSGQHPAVSGQHPAVSGQHPAVSGQHPAIATGPHAAVSGPHPAVTSGIYPPQPPRTSWLKALSLMLGGGALVGALAGLLFFRAAGGGADAGGETEESEAARERPVVTPLSPAEDEQGEGITIAIASDPEGASVYTYGDLSEEPICPPTPCTFSPGKQGPSVRKYIVDKEGYKSEEIEVDLGDVPDQISVTLEKSR